MADLSIKKDSKQGRDLLKVTIEYFNFNPDAYGRKIPLVRENDNNGNEDIKKD